MKEGHRPRLERVRRNRENVRRLMGPFNNPQYRLQLIEKRHSSLTQEASQENTEEK